MKKYFVIILLFLLAFTLCGNAIAQEVDYPNVPGAETPGSGTTLPGFIVYIFNFALFLGVVITGGSVLFAGILYLTAGANRSRLEKAKSRIKYAFFGLVLLLSSYLLLNTINPNLTVFEIPSAPHPTTTPPTVNSTSTTEITDFQEIPIGTLLEKMVAKNIDCYEEGDTYGTLRDCQDNKEVQVGPANSSDSAVASAREGYCYDFDSDGNFIDASSSANGINPMTEHDRLDCIKKLQKPINVRMQKLKKWSKDLKQAVQQCKCKKCKKTGPCSPVGCPSTDCQGDPKCVGRPYDQPPKDPCPNRNQIKDIRKKIRRNYTDKQLKKMTVKYFKEKSADTQQYGKNTVLVADQVRFLMVNLLKPLEKGLKKDLANLRKSENTLKKCPYQLTFNHSKFFKLKESTATTTMKAMKFCEEPASGSLNPKGKIMQSCAEVDKTEINQYCQEFNCANCWQGSSNNKLKCEKCNLDNLQHGKVVNYTVGTAASPRTSYKCNRYQLNNERGEDFDLDKGCNTEDGECKLCKIENEQSGNTKEKECVSHDDDPVTFYCPKVGTEMLSPGALTTNKCTVIPSVKEGYRTGQIRIGEAVDRGERFGKLIYEEVEEINNKIKDATNALFNPKPGKKGKLKTPAGDLDVLYSLPLSCRCKPDSYYTINGSPAGGECEPQCNCVSTDECNCHTEYDSDGDPYTVCVDKECNDCDKKCVGAPCAMGKITSKVNIVKDSRKIIQKSFKRLIYLATDNKSELKKDDPHRTEIINKLYDARPKIERCVTGFGHTKESEQVLRRFMSCYKALDLIKLNNITIKPWFPVPKSNESCYPYNYNQVYSNGGFKGNFKFTSNEVDSCRNNIEGKECEGAIEDIGENGGMYNFFCCEE